MHWVVIPTSTPCNLQPVIYNIGSEAENDDRMGLMSNKVSGLIVSVPPQLNTNLISMSVEQKVQKLNTVAEVNKFMYDYEQQHGKMSDRDYETCMLRMDDFCDICGGTEEDAEANKCQCVLEVEIDYEENKATDDYEQAKAL